LNASFLSYNAVTLRITDVLSYFYIAFNKAHRADQNLLKGECEKRNETANFVSSVKRYVVYNNSPGEFFRTAAMMGGAAFSATPPYIFNFFDTYFFHKQIPFVV
jgi:hypothetical protein